MIKVHMDDLISCHVVGCSKLATKPVCSQILSDVK